MAFTNDAPVHLLKNKSRQSRKPGKWCHIGKQNCFFRSEWERKFAHYLENRKLGKDIKSWKYEAKTFWFLKIKRGVRSFKPDFKVINNDGSVEWFEVKGWMDPRSSTKLKRMAKYYPKVKITVIDQRWFVDFQGKCGILKSYLLLGCSP